MMDDILLNLLKTNGRVIIPDFGAFIIKSKSPFKVIFNEFLQYNDGALIGSVASSFSLERDEAAIKVKEYVTEISEQLNKGSNISLEGIGVLSKSSTGKITLSDSIEESQAQKAANTSQTPTTVEFDLNETDEKKSDAPKQEEKPIIKPEVKKEPVKPEPKKEFIAPKPTPVEKPTEKKPEPKKEEKPTPTPIIQEGDTSKNKLNIILWFVLILIVNGAIISYFFFGDEIKGLIGKDKNKLQEQIIETPIISEDTTPIDTTPIPAEEMVYDEPLEQDNSSQIMAGEKYFVVAGVFSEEKNAINLVNELKQDGFNAEQFGMIGKMYAVSYDVFPTKKEADNFMFKIKREVDAEAWIRTVK